MGDLGLAPRSVGLKVPYNHFYTNRPFAVLVYHKLSTCQHQFFRFSLTIAHLAKSEGLGETAQVGLEPTTQRLTAACNYHCATGQLS